MKRTASLTRKTPLRSSSEGLGPARASVPVFRPKTCAVKKGGCGEKFTPTRAMQPVCGKDQCRFNFAMRTIGKSDTARKRKAAALARDDKARTRVALEAIKTVPMLKKEAQAAVNLYVRLRDNGGQCFVCGDSLRMGGVGGGFDAGHIRSRSEADHLRYDVDRNLFGQCKPCNAAGSTKPYEMRAAAERKLGPEVAAELYADNRVIKWTRDGLREIRDRYRALNVKMKKDS